MKRRNTHQRDLILQNVLGKKHYTVDDVLLKVREEDPNIGIATVYRNLNLFVEEGLIQKISGEGFSYYDGDPAPHDHLHCVCCGRVYDCPEHSYDEGMDSEMSKAMGAEVKSHSTTFEGICKECLAKNKVQASDRKIS